MRYIKHFEELKWSTYSSAARKLRGISPKKNKQRADDLVEHADRMELKRVRQELSGVMTPVSIWIGCADSRVRVIANKNEGVGRFYAVPYMEYDMFEEMIEDGSVKEIPFTLVITPVDEEAETICKEVMPEGTGLSLSGIGAFWLSIELKLEDGTHELGRIKVVNMDQYVYGNCELQGRAAYGNIKNTLQKMFTDKSGEFYEEFEQRIIAGHGLSSEYGLSMEAIANHLKSLSVNTGFMAD